MQQSITNKNQIDNFVLDMVNFNNNQVDFVGSKSENQNSEYGMYRYNIPNFSYTDYKEYSEILKNCEQNKIIYNDELYMSLVNDLTKIVARETATWVPYTSKQIYRTKNEIKKLDKSIYTYNANKEENELMFNSQFKGCISGRRELCCYRNGKLSFALACLRVPAVIFAVSNCS